MNQDYFIKKLSDNLSITKKKDELPLARNITKRLKVLSHDDSEFEVSYHIATILEHLEPKFKKNQKAALLLNELEEKITQLIIYKIKIIKDVELFNNELNTNEENKFNFEDNYAILITEAESIIQKTSSILDLTVQLYSNLKKNDFVNNFGRWIRKQRNGALKDIVESDFQSKTFKFTTLILNYGINNRIKHHESLQIFPGYSKSTNSSVLCLTGKACNSELIDLSSYINILTEELIDFVRLWKKKLKNVSI